MIKNKSFLRILWIFLWATGIMSACNLTNPALATPFTETPVGKTGAIQLTLTAFAQPTTTRLPTTTSSPIIVTATPQPIPIPNPLTGSDTPTPSSNIQPTPGPNTITEPPCDRAVFTSDITFPDESILAPGDTFVKTWRLKNIGTCAWKTDYALVFVGRNGLGGPASTPLSGQVVAPGTTVDVSVTLHAPSTAGSYESDWMLRNSAGHLFGLGPQGDGFFWVKIRVTGNNQRLTLKPGATSINVNGIVNANKRVSYLVNAAADQLMMVAINTLNLPFAIEVLTPSGVILVSASNKMTFWQGALPVAGNYLVSIVNTGAATQFNFSVTLPVRVNFQPGISGATLKGVIQPRAINTYILQALKDQTLTVSIQSGLGDVYLTIFGNTDGSPYIRSVTAQKTFSFKLPSTQDYVIQCVSAGDKPEYYSVGFEVK